MECIDGFAFQVRGEMRGLRVLQQCVRANKQAGCFSGVATSYFGRGCRICARNEYGMGYRKYFVHYRWKRAIQSLLQKELWDSCREA